MSTAGRSLGVALLLTAAAGLAHADLRRATGSIVNGVPTSGSPATGALLWPGSPGSAHLLCSGTMIGCRTFLTAGHCVEGFLDPEDYVVFLQHAGFFSVASVSLHPDYAFPPADVAVLVLDQPMTGIRPVPIDVVGGQPTGTIGTIVGFGAVGGPASAAGLKRTGVVSTAPCAAGVSDTTSICWAFENPIGPPGTDSNTCSGDSGGPLFVAAGGGDVVAGITSGGFSTDCLAPDLSFDARVSFYASWISGQSGPDLASTRCGPEPQLGDVGTTVVPYQGSVSPSAPEGRHQLVVPAGLGELRITMNAVDDGPDFDLYVKRGAPPTTTDFDCAQAGSGQFGACLFGAPAGDTWHVLVRRFSGSGDYQVTATMLGAVCTPGDEGLPCDDADVCTVGETCQAGACTGGSPIGCDDGVACTTDLCHPAIGCQNVPNHATCGPCQSCDGAAGCVAAPRPDCRGAVQPLVAKLKLKDAASDTGDLFLWKLARGEATMLADFGDPAATDGLRLCLYDESGPAPAEILRAEIPAGGTCGGQPCWSAAGTRGFKYKNRDATPDGVQKVVLFAGAAGRTKAIVKAKGVNLPSMPVTPLGLPLRVQLHTDAGVCWESGFTGAGASRNAGGIFVGRGD